MNNLNFIYREEQEAYGSAELLRWLSVVLSIFGILLMVASVIVSVLPTCPPLLPNCQSIEEGYYNRWLIFPGVGIFLAILAVAAFMRTFAASVQLQVIRSLEGDQVE